jgi:glycosyltransferase involved in cell wall biosynthesis
MEVNKKILIVANGIIGEDPSPSGGDVRFLMLAKEWDILGYEIHILSSEGCQKLIDQFGFKAKLHILEWKHEGEVKRSSFIWRAVTSFFWIPKSLNNFDGIVYSANDSLFDVLPSWRLKLKRKNRVKWCAIVHWIPPFPPWKRKQSSAVNSLFFYFNVVMSVTLARWCADNILPVSYSTAKQLLTYYVPPEKIYPVKCGVEFDKIQNFRSHKFEKKFDAIFMKRIQGVKGAFDLVDIWKKVVKNKPDAILAIIGDEGEDSNILRQKVSDAGLKANVVFLGYVYDVEKKFEYLNSSRLFILPSYEENWAISLGEAMCSQLPCLAYNLPELKEIWGENVGWVELGNTEEFSDLILRYLEDKVLYNKNIAAGKEFTSQLDWSILAKDELSFMNN